MRKTLTLLVASTALTAAIGLPAWSMMQAPADGAPRPFATILEDDAQAPPVILASNDDDDRGYRETSRRGHDDDDDDDDHDEDDHDEDDHDEDDDDDHDDDDDDDDRSGARDPAPAGTVAPPQNGLFGNGAAPKAKVN